MSLLIALISTAAIISANASGTSDWIAGNGDTTITEVADGIQVSSPNMSYGSDDDHTWNGVASANKYKLDGLTLVYTYTDIAEVPGGDDCWICISFMNQPYPFVTSDNTTNQGYANLIRYSGNYDGSNAEWHHIEALGAFGEAYTDSLDFAIAPGTQITMECKLVNGEYIFTLNGNECSTGFPDLVSAFPDGTAYIVIKNYYSSGDGNGFTMVLNSINGAALNTPAEAETETPAVADASADAADTAAATVVTTQTTASAAQTADITVITAIIAFGSAVVIGKKKR